MLDTLLYIMFAAMVVSLVAMGVENENNKQSFFWGSMAILFSAMCMVGVLNIETGYSYVYENIENGDVTVMSDVRSYDDAAPLAVLFFGIILIVALMLMERGFSSWEGKKKLI